jgi:hypothetical protein
MHLNLHHFCITAFVGKMNNDYQTIIEGLKSKIELIISKYEEVSSDNQRLTQELGQCRSDLNTSINKNKELEEKINKLQLTGAFTTSSTDVKEAKQKIGKIIKEIDKCIALLND